MKNITQFKGGDSLFADVILGNNIDTPKWIEELQVLDAENIIVIDYEYFGELKLIGGVLYISPIEAKSYLEKFDSICFFKTMYVYPGMGGKMSTFRKN